MYFSHCTAAADTEEKIRISTYGLMNNDHEFENCLQQMTPDRHPLFEKTIHMMQQFFRSARSIAIIIVWTIGAQQVRAQEPAFYKDIQAFKKQDSISAVPKNAILFIGSSSFTLWKDVQDYFPGYTIINRGFGGASLHHLSYYIRDIVYPYHPKQVVIYCGENDLAASNTVSPETVTHRFITLFYEIRDHYPRVPIAYVAMKPSPSREKLMEKMEKGNQAIAAFLKTQPDADYIDVYTPMLNPAGKPRAALFVEDMLHMNKDGYAIWQEVLLPYLRK